MMNDRMNAMNDRFNAMNDRFKTTNGEIICKKEWRQNGMERSFLHTETEWNNPFITTERNGPEVNSK